MISIVAALVLSQTQPQVTGALNTLYAAWQDRANRTITGSPTGCRTRVCVRPAGGTLPGGTVTLRFGAVSLSAPVQNALGLCGVVTKPAPVIVEVQAVAASAATYDRRALLAAFDVIEERDGALPHVEVRGSPVNALCEVGIVRVDDAAMASSLNGLTACACSTGAACKAGDGVTAAPQKRTLQPGEFTPSAACRSKPCQGRLDSEQGVDRTWPAACPR